MISSAIALSFGPSQSGNAAAIPLVSAGTSYSQTFDTLITTGTGSFTGDSTIDGWFAIHTGTGSQILADAGSSTAGSIYSYGTGTSTERALGSIGSSNPAAGSYAYGAYFVNNSGALVNNIRISYAGEIWRSGVASSTNTLSFSYMKDSTTTAGNTVFEASAPVASGTPPGWTAFSALNFSLTTNGSPIGPRDGNAAANRTTFTDIVLTGLSLSAGERLFIRWEDPDHAGADNGTAIDDFTIKYTVSSPALTYSNTSGAVFGNLLLGANASTTVTLTNTGSGASTSITPGTVSGFTLGVPVDETLAASDFTTAVVTANTSVAGSYSGTATYTANPGSVVSPGFTVSSSVGQAVYGDAVATKAATPVSSSLSTALSATGTGTAAADTPKALHSVVSVLFYTNSTSGDTGEVAVKMRTRTASEAATFETLQTTEAPNVGGSAKYLYSDVADVTGMIDTGTTTDTFVLQMSYDPALLVGSETALAALGNIFLGSYNGSAWVNAVALNTTGTAEFVNRAYQAGDELVVGRYGIDTAANTVWAVLNHNSEFAVIPEPSSFAAAGVAMLGLTVVGLRRRRCSKPVTA